MSGGELWEDRGVIPRVFSYLFENIASREDEELNVFVSYFEIYNENAFDLLDRAHAEMPFEKWNKITLFEDKSGNLHMKNLSVHSCRSEQEAIDLLMAGNFIRQVSETPMN
jgi:kinesin family protein 6/9